MSYHIISTIKNWAGTIQGQISRFNVRMFLFETVSVKFISFNITLKLFNFSRFASTTTILLPTSRKSSNKLLLGYESCKKLDLTCWFVYIY
uniref:CSON005221 protein n=1 Tax=Culicoides sonorensis TaxID=179676 RepID=A0A336MV58_CULSO